MPSPPPSPTPLPTLRSRPKSKPTIPSNPPSPSPSSNTSTTTPSRRSPSTKLISPLDTLRLLTGLLLLSCTLSYFITGTSFFWNYRPPFTRPARIRAWFRPPLLLTDAQLSLYNGTDTNLPILLALNGTIYDVSASPHMYGPGGSYSFFAGRDATRAFVTGCFEEDLNGDLRGVEEMFMPAEGEGGGIKGEGSRDGGISGEVSREEKRERKVRRERERRVARKQVEDVVRGWEGLFDGGKGGRYFRVGRVERGVGSGWGGWGERKELCAKAREGRPVRRAGEVG